jgi:hypothetical protein
MVGQAPFGDAVTLVCGTHRKKSTVNSNGNLVHLASKDACASERYMIRVEKLVSRSEAFALLTPVLEGREPGVEETIDHLAADGI